MKTFIKVTLVLVLIGIVLLSSRLKNNDNEESGLIVSYADEETLKTLRSIVTSATIHEGIVNMAKPHYKIIIDYEDNSNEQFYLWITENEIGALMSVEDTHSLYTLSGDMSIKLYGFLQPSIN